MQLSELIAEFRQRADDKAEPFLADDATVTGYLNEAQFEACIRAKLLHDNSSALTRVVVPAGETSLVLDPRIIDLIEVRIQAQAGTAETGYVPIRGCTLRRESLKHIEAYQNRVVPNGFTVPYNVQPERYQTIGEGDGDSTGMTLQLDRGPGQDLLLALTVVRLPLDEMTGDADTPEIHVQHHRNMILWALHLHFDTRDADVSSVDRAKDFEARFTQAFGERPSADTQMTRLRHKAPVTRVRY